ncbi:unnamed protein product [Fraxinus pennsylvanica]|uniref:Uncharacterized protein n=1 Tax=Fraxinus pennsylvanica TaxID=56036 RepID=A0AAD2AI04_9LAMI|nr:unnamed protein product [Fraxinus pennsylvanica]
MIQMAVAVPLAKPNCTEKCGNVIIPYPFGIGQNCSANSSYTVSCRNQTTLWLSSIDLEVIEISLENGTITLNQPVLPINCSYDQKELSLGISLLGTPFIFSMFYNKFVVLGCKNVVKLRTNETTTDEACVAICRGPNSTDISCNGVDCCQASIPPQLQEMNIIYTSTGSGVSNNNSTCGYTFLADQKWIQNDYKKYRGFEVNFLYPFDDTFVYAPVVLDWKFPIIYDGRVSCEYPSHYNSYYGEFTNYEDPLRCFCETGFEGNPYLDEGCQDIDECSNSTLNYCFYGQCINTQGSYTCEIARSIHFDNVTTSSPSDVDPLLSATS